MRSAKAWRLAAAFLVLLTLSQCFTERQSESQRLYSQQCASCHMDDGSGLRGLIPPLANSDYLTRYRESLPCLIRHGQQGEILVNGVRYNRPMPANKELQQAQITNILNYIQTHFGNNNEVFTVQEVNQYLKNCRP